ncbi:bifunctional UDP-sugar hydrolase/5'-nucleotidase [Mycoplasma sp. 1018B]|uniref:bifunctional metallophosphatase/5'-nucleotidase n=1 Tax=Mycoplasma sp. 1018B TaxID=2967302 RepID=UPI00211D0D9C|nr:5'-nucleotidase C-terminal domain-containing protein [Mycoplasma sp. 1018B]UUM19039.1 5'-nucleotidase C-terminal domain-containing protein [Mycoplasma sp. 1018B]
MKLKIKKLFSTVISAGVLLSPLAFAIACNDTSKTTKDDENILPKKQFSQEEIKKQQSLFDDFENKYNSALETKAKEYTTKKAEIEKMKNSTEAQKQAKTAAEEEFKNWLSATRTEFANLKAQYNELFNKLKEVEESSIIKTIKIYHTNDEHGRILFDDGRFNNYSGLEGLAQYMEGLPRDLLLSAGDLIQGLPLSDSDKGKTITQLATELKYDSIAVGNHEFDYGLNTLLELNKMSTEKNTPFLSANITWKNDGTHNGIQHKAGDLVFKPYIIKNINNYKVAIVGITTPDTAYTSNPKNSVDVTFNDPTESFNKISQKLKDEEKVNFVIALTHLGVGRNERNWESIYLAQNAKDLDLILDGHSHTKYEAQKVENSQTWLTQTEAYTKYLGDITIRINSETGVIESLRSNLRDINQIQVARTGTRSAKYEELISKLEQEYNKVNNVIVFNNSVNFIHATRIKVGNSNYATGRVKQSNLGTFAADANVWKFIVEGGVKNQSGKAEATLDNTIGLINGGGLRTDLATGEVKRGDIVGISPFGNRLVGLEISGTILKQVFAHSVNKIKSGGYGQWSHNVSFEASATENNKKYTYAIKEGTLKINNKDIVDDQKYYLITNDYLAVGGDQYEMINKDKQLENVQLVYEGDAIADVIGEYAKKITEQEVQENKNSILWKMEKYSQETATNFIKIEFEPTTK